MLNELLCRLRGHEPKRRRAWHDGIDYRTACRRCGVSLIRSPEGWRVFDRSVDDDPRRLPHPVARGRQASDQVIDEENLVVPE